MVAGKVAALIGLFYGPGSLPGMTTIFEREPSSWIPFSALVITGLVALLVRGRPEGSRRTPRDAVLAASPFVLTAGAFALAVVLLPDVRWERWLFAPTLVAGVVLLVWPRGALVRAAIPPAAAFACLSVLVIGAGVRLEGGVGDVTVRPRSAAQLPREVRRGVGDVELDLARLPGGPRRLSLDASVGVGSIDVKVPRRTLVELDARVGEGRHVVEGASGHGRISFEHLKVQERRGRITGRGTPVGDGGRPVRPRMRFRLRLRLRTGVGEIKVSDESSSTRWQL